MTHPTKWTSLDKKMNTFNHQHAGDSDESFGDNGKISLSNLPHIDGTDRHVKGLCILGSGKIIVGAVVSHDDDPATLYNSAYYGLARLNEDGSLDTTFADQGFRFGKFKAPLDASGGKILEQGSKIYMLGWTHLDTDSSEPPPHLVVCRFTEQGDLDKDFAVQGRQIFQNQTGEVFVPNSSNCAFQGEKIVISATYRSSGSETTHGVLYRVNLKGQLDTSFNKTGRLDIRLNDTDRAIALHAVHIQNGEKILLAGCVKQSDDMKGFFARLNSDGSTDKTFGASATPGSYVLNVKEGDTVIQGLIQTTNNGFIGFGNCGRTEKFMKGLLIRMMADGVPDHLFNLGKPVLTAFDERTGDNWQAGFMDAAERINVVGSYKKLHIARFLSNGTVDKDFGSNGYIEEDTAISAEPALLQRRSKSRFIFAGNTSGIGGGLGVLWAYLS